MGFDAGQMQNALGVAGSLSCGLMEFARSGTGAMVKRLHLGRAAESGVLAASLAGDGFTGPVSVLEGEFGFLRVFCGDAYDAGELTRGLGDSYATRSIMLKRFPCHITAHTSVQAILDLRAEHGYDGADVASIHIAGNDKMATGQQHHLPRRHHDGAIQHSVLRRARPCPRPARPALLRRNGVARPANPRRCASGWPLPSTTTARRRLPQPSRSR